MVQKQLNPLEDPIPFGIRDAAPLPAHPPAASAATAGSQGDLSIQKLDHISKTCGLALRVHPFCLLNEQWFPSYCPCRRCVPPQMLTSLPQQSYSTAQSA
eukprot:1147255-Pelagomonas_calceolata.AAC.4